MEIPGSWLVVNKITKQVISRYRHQAEARMAVQTLQRYLPNWYCVEFQRDEQKVGNQVHNC
jgi:hypothetical protein